jgi:hypothetical protein
VSLVVPPYPPARYTEDEPEVSAWLRRGDQPADFDSFGLVQYHYLANQGNTNGDYGLYRVELAPKAGGPGPHFHRAHISKRPRISKRRGGALSSCCRGR